MKFARRQLMAGAALLGATAAIPSWSFRRVGQALAAGTEAVSDRDARLYGELAPFSRELLRAKAAELAGRPFEDRTGAVPETLRAMGYSAYRQIGPSRVWPQPLSADRSFSFDALLPGFVYNQPVDLWLVSDDTAQRIVYEPAAYVVGELAAAQLPEGPLPFSGFRLHADVGATGEISEFAVFQGASYFRAVGAGETYGLSARGLAIDTGSPRGEEFPIFRGYWIEAVPDGGASVVVHALLDTPSASGVAHMTLTPGDATITEVELTVFARRTIETVGFAPFSSMFLFGGVNRSRFEDYRPAVHDSDGLSIHTGAGEWLWRPLNNPTRLQVSAFADDGPRGFGLAQRHRRFEDYQDVEARYDLRTSAWVEPLGNWGAGSVVLFEIPTDKEYNDNIVAYWQPGTPIVPGVPTTFAYRIQWDALPREAAPGPRVLSTRIGRTLADDALLFVIDYVTNGLDLEDAVVRVEASTGTASNLVLYDTPVPGVARISFELDPKGADSSELRLELDPVAGPPAERWLYRWTS
ncbi:glucan biosynthesis protein [Acuticoccus sp.]|uniref:glucan biosynthesis protein n=1 Tax=Acuticoccus sp. TaxID=1904378 RepID=UPI003B5181B7